MSDTKTKKLIEVSLPLDSINDASSYDKLPGIGTHPKRMHHWWARLPLPCARAILFASLVDDPAYDPDADKSEEAQQEERERLFGIIEDLVQKKPYQRPDDFEDAQREIERACDGEVPELIDPFAGGGSIPLEGQRLGLKSKGSDINPVAVLLNRAQLEIAPRFKHQSPVRPNHEKQVAEKKWRGTRSLAEDVRYYGQKILEEARDRIGHLFPQVDLPEEQGGGRADAITWFWARTAPSPNPAVDGKHVPLIRSFSLSTKKNRKVWVEPIVDHENLEYSFEVRRGEENNAPSGTYRSNTGGKCIFTGDPMPLDYLREQGQKGDFGVRLVAISADGQSHRVYVSPNEKHVQAAEQASPSWSPDFEMPSDNSRWFSPPGYGMKTYGELFTPRQLVGLNTFSELIRDIRSTVHQDAVESGLADDGRPFADGGEGATAYADSIATLLSFALDRLADYNSALSTWVPSGEQQKHVFTRQAIPMVWDFVEANVLGDRSIAWTKAVDYVANSIESVVVNNEPEGIARQEDAATSLDGESGVLVSTDPPYYDNIGYADISDFFYVWLRHTLHDIHPDLFQTILIPKQDELVASPYKFGGSKEKAREHFEEGFREAFSQLKERMDPRFPLTVYYAFRQSDEEVDLGGEGGGITLTTGWETFLEALVSNGFQITATWPVRASQKWRMGAMGTNSLASYIVLACRARPEDASRITRGEFLKELKRELPEALSELQQGHIAPVDFAQACIGPGMAVFSRYSQVVEADGSSMSVRSALSLINQVLGEYLAEQEAEYDADTRWALAWYEQFGFESGEYGEAETLSKAKNTSVRGMEEAGFLDAGGGTVRLLGREEMDADWHPAEDERLTVWEATQHLIRALNQDGEEGAARLLAALENESSATAEAARDLAYRLYSLCDQQDRSEEALDYNSLIVAWPQIEQLAQEKAQEMSTPEQGEIFD